MVVITTVWINFKIKDDPDLWCHRSNRPCFLDNTGQYFSAVGVVGDLDLDADCATGPFCSSCMSSCAIPPRVVGGLLSDMELGVWSVPLRHCGSGGDWELSWFFLFDFYF